MYVCIDRFIGEDKDDYNLVMRDVLMYIINIVILINWC